MDDTSVRWEERATFNPAAVVRAGKVYLLYRAEDTTGLDKIGHHTSRLGLPRSDIRIRNSRRDSATRRAN